MMYDIVIVGGGVVGLTLAALIAKSNLNILVIEKNIIAKNLHDYDLRCSAINLHSCQLFEKLNLLDKILNNAKYGKFKEIKIHTEQESLEFIASDINADFLGYILQNQAMVNELLNYLKQYNNITLLSANAQTLNAAENYLLLNDGTNIAYKFLVLADGRNSKLRQMLGIECYHYDYQDSALVATVKTSINNPQIATQFFNDTAILAFLPLNEDNHFSIVLSQDKNSNNKLLQMDLKSLGYVLAEKSLYKFGQIEVLGAVASFDLVAQHAKNYVVAHNVVLVGDSAHSIHPLAGQGLNLGLNDVKHLAELINNKQLHYRYLRQYEREVKLQNSLFLHSMSALRKVFKTNWPINLALRSLNNFSFAKTFFTKAAVFGLTNSSFKC